LWWHLRESFRELNLNHNNAVGIWMFIFGIRQLIFQVFSLKNNKISNLSESLDL
jgi:hypothetical protein